MLYCNLSWCARLLKDGLSLFIWPFKLKVDAKECVYLMKESNMVLEGYMDQTQASGMCLDGAPWTFWAKGLSLCCVTQ